MLCHSFAHRAIYCPRFRADHFRISFTCPEFQTRHCTPCNNLSQFWHCHYHLCNVMPQISDSVLHTRHYRVPDFREQFCHPCNIVSVFHIVIAPPAMASPKFRTDFCTPGNVMSQIWNRLLEKWSDNIDFSDRPLQFWNTMSPKSLIPSENKNELSGNPDRSCRFKNAMFLISE